MKLLSWNVNGLRACLQKGFLDAIVQQQPDIIALQETKMLPEQADISLPGYSLFWNSAIKKGYSGTAVFTKVSPLSIRNGLGNDAFDSEGRTMTVEFDDFFLVNSYSPNSQDGLKRIDFRLSYDHALRSHLQALSLVKPVILCGDLNVAHQELDLKNPKSNMESAGFSQAERSSFSDLLHSGFVDSFRYFYPDKTGAYTWWSYRFHARENNAGWRIDYFVVSEDFVSNLDQVSICSDILGSDHCPITLTIKENSI